MRTIVIDVQDLNGDSCINCCMIRGFRLRERIFRCMSLDNTSKTCGGDGVGDDGVGDGGDGDGDGQGWKIYRTMGPLVPENFGFLRKYFKFTFIKYFR